MSGTADPGKAAQRQRLAEALRANLGRRKAQQRDRRGDAAENKTAQSAQSGANTKGAGTKQE